MPRQAGSRLSSQTLGVTISATMKKSSRIRYPLFELTGSEFEHLAADLLAAADPELTLSPADSRHWVDAIGSRRTSSGIRTVAMEASHRRSLQGEALRRFVDRIAKEDHTFDEFIFVTSSPVGEATRAALLSAAVDYSLTLIGQDELLALLDKHQRVAAKYFRQVKARVQVQRSFLLVSSAGVVLSLLGLGSGLYNFIATKSEPPSALSMQVKSVEDSLARLGDLERGLLALKVDLENKARESAQVSKEYEEAMRLKALTSEQLESVRRAVSSQSRSDVFWNYFFGFILGVAGSVVATILTDKWKQRRSLADPDA